MRYAAARFLYGPRFADLTSASSMRFTISPISQSLLLRPAAIAGDVRSVQDRITFASATATLSLPCSALWAKRSPGSRLELLRGLSSTRTKLRHGMACTARSKCAGSITSKPIRSTAHVRIGPRNISAACVARKPDTIIISPARYLLRYAQDENHRRMSNGDQAICVAGLAIRKYVSPDFTGYWQRHLQS